MKEKIVYQFRRRGLYRSITSALLLAGALSAGAVVSFPAAALAQDQAATAPDNSKQNAHQGITADQQSDRKKDMALTRKIRKSVISDKSLSTYAHNVKIITRHGVVTLKGPVASEDEKQVIASKAESIAGGGAKVRNELTVDASGK